MKSLLDFKPLFLNLRSIALYSSLLTRNFTNFLRLSFSDFLLVFITSFFQIGVLGDLIPWQAVWLVFTDFRGHKLPCLLLLHRPVRAVFISRHFSCLIFTVFAIIVKLLCWNKNTLLYIYRQIRLFGKEIAKYSQKICNWIVRILTQHIGTGQSRDNII